MKMHPVIVPGKKKREQSCQPFPKAFLMTKLIRAQEQAVNLQTVGTAIQTQCSNKTFPFF